MNDDLDGACQAEALVSHAGSLDIVTDEIAILLDDLAGLGEHWARNREKSHMPKGIRDAMVQTAQEIAMRIETGNDLSSDCWLTTR